MTSKNIYTPYFYIIRHKETNIKYAGSKWAKGCHPDEFMQPNGYTTSSNIINSIIEQDGLDSFEILRIDTNCDGLQPHDYETLFLETIDCASSPDWYNGHNNKLSGFGTLAFIKSMQHKYNVDNPGQLEYVKKINSENMKNITFEKSKTNSLLFQDSEFNRCTQLKLVAEGRHNFQGKLGSKKATERNNQQVLDGSHPFLGGEVQRKMNIKRVEDGSHPFLGGKIQKQSQLKLVAEGRHHSQTEKFSIEQSDRQKELVNKCKHHFLSGEIQSKHNKLMVARFSYQIVKNLFEQLKIIKPKCLHRKSDGWLYQKYEELLVIEEYRKCQC